MCFSYFERTLQSEEKALVWEVLGGDLATSTMISQTWVWQGCTGHQTGWLDLLMKINLFSKELHIASLVTLCSQPFLLNWRKNISMILLKKYVILDIQTYNFLLVEEFLSLGKPSINCITKKSVMHRPLVSCKKNIRRKKKKKNRTHLKCANFKCANCILPSLFHSISKAKISHIICIRADVK